MSIFFVLCALIISSGMDTETPEAFLDILAASDAEIWIEHQFSGNSQTEIHPDSIRSIIGTKRNLSVELGERILEDVDFVTSFSSFLFPLNDPLRLNAIKITLAPINIRSIVKKVIIVFAP